MTAVEIRRIENRIARLPKGKEYLARVKGHGIYMRFPTLTFSDVFESVGKVSGLEPAEFIYNKRRDSMYVMSRNISCYISYMENLGSLKQIAIKTNLRDHSAVIHAKNRVYDLMQSGDEVTIRFYNQVINLLETKNKNAEV